MDQVALSTIRKHHLCMILSQERKGICSSRVMSGPSCGVSALCAAHSSRTSFLPLRTWTQALCTLWGVADDSLGPACPFSRCSLSNSACVLSLPLFFIWNQVFLCLQAGPSAEPTMWPGTSRGSSLIQQRDFTYVCVAPKYTVISIS